MIKSFKCKDTNKIWEGLSSRKFPYEIQNIARRKLRMIAAAKVIDALKVPPANRLEKLYGDRKGQCSIRINDQWRICFLWKDGDAYLVEIVDYH